jgi:uncharacterized membrane protein (UPF0127 family)
MVTCFSAGQGIRDLSVRFLQVAAIMIMALAVVACSGDADAKAPEGTIALTMKGESGKEQRLFVEVAATQEQRGVGLSKRTELDADRGMLFIIPTHGLGFWMKDTLIPLSVAFIGPCGEIVFIADMEPQTETLYDTDRPYKYGLETNQGWFREHGIDVGSTVDIPEEYRQPECSYA